MCKSLVLLKEKMYDNFDNPEFAYKAKIVNTSDDVMETLSIFVRLEMPCLSNDCHNLVESSISIKTSRKIYKILRDITYYMADQVDIDLYCPVCGENMFITEIEIEAEETNEDE